jgi:hypothetical protein
LFIIHGYYSRPASELATLLSLTAQVMQNGAVTPHIAESADVT